jgi:Peptidase family C25
LAAALVSQGSIVTQPATGGTGFVEWNPGVVVGGDSASLSYTVNVTPPSAARLPVTGTPALNGTTARYVDETGNVTQGRATYQWGPLCSLAVTAGTSVPTPATLAKVQSTRSGEFVDIEWLTDAQVGVAWFDLLVPDINGDWQPLPDARVMAEADSMEATPYALRVRTAASQFMLQTRDIDGQTQRIGPFPVGAQLGEAPQHQRTPWAQIHDTLAQQRTPAAASAMRRADIKVDQDGIQQVAFEALPDSAQWSGVPIDSLALTERGTPVPLHINSADGVFGPGDSIEFIGQKEGSIYTNERIYRLQVDAANALRVVERRSADTATAIKASHQSVVRLDDNRLYGFASPLPDPWYVERLTARPQQPTSKNYVLNVANLMPGAAQLRVVVWGGIDYPGAEADHILRLSLNGVALGERQFDGVNALYFDVAVADSTLRDGANTVTLTLPGTTHPVDIIHLEAIELRYQSALNAANGALQISDFDDATAAPADLISGAGFERALDPVACTTATGSSRCVAISTVGWTQAPSAWLRSTDGKVEVWRDLPAPTAGAARFDVVKGSVADIQLVSAQTLKRPSVGSSIASDTVRENELDVLIITHPQFRAGAETLASRREAQGLSVAVVDTTTAYSLYSGGTVDPAAIAALIRTAWDLQRVRYVVLVGADTLDYFNRLGDNAISFVPTRYLRLHSVVNHAPSDASFADVDGDGAPDVALGRLAVRTPAELTQVLAKIAQFEASPAQGGLFINDRTDGNGVSFAARSSYLQQQFPQPSSASNLDTQTIAQTRQSLVSAVSNGVTLISYYGHSSMSSWSLPAPGLMTPSEIYGGSLASAANPTVLLQLGCWNTYHVQPRYDTLGSAWLLGPGAAVAVIGSAALADADHAWAFGAEFLRATANSPRLGDALLAAQRATWQNDPDAVDVILGTTLLGDPTLRWPTVQ